MSYWEIKCDEDFFSTLDIKLREGRFFLPSEKGRAYIVNEKFYKEAGFKDLSTATCRDIPIVGVIEDFNTESLHNEIKPGAILFSDEDLTCLSLRISSENVPKTLDLASAAPLLCAGITVYSPLKHWQAGPGKMVGILGIGGLGHVAIKIAKAVGAHVVVFTTSPSKLETFTSQS